MLPSRSFSIATVAIALVATCVLSAPTVRAADPAPRYAAADLGQLLNGAPQLVIAGERLNVELLRRFYARHGFAAVWTTRQPQAASLLSAVMRAGDQGLAPELFHANLLRSAAALPPLDRDLLLSDAFLSYADALSRGVVPVERRRDDEALAPEPVDVAAALDAVIASPNPEAAMEALAPATPTYRALRQALQTAQPGIRLRQIEVNLERERWLPRRLPADRVWVNVADERLVFYRGGQPVFSTKVIVGQDERRNQSPEFQTMITGLLFNPPWNIPPDIAADEILPKASRDPNYLARRHMVMLPNGGLQQLAGPNSALGQLMFEMRNRFDVYLHDTPSKNFFSREDRRISHGCIRVEEPRELAALLMHQPVDVIDHAIAMGGTAQTNLPQPVPVFVVYETAFADVDGRLQFRPDIYGRDAEIWPHLVPERGPLAEREPLGPRGG